MRSRVLATILFRQRFFWIALVLLAVVSVWAVRSCHHEVDKDWRFIKACGIRLPMHYTIHGIDVSKHNNRINWKRVANMQADGVRLQFVFIKATEGATLTDKSFSQNWREARKAHIRRGAYHFYHPTRDPIKQANNFIKNVTLKEGDFAPVLDFEVVNGVPEDELVEGIRLWLETIEQHYKIRPIIYTNASLYKRYIKKHFDGYPLWIADYSNTHLRDYNHDKLYIWQHSQAGWVDGIRGMVDFNTFVQDPEQLTEICL